MSPLFVLRNLAIAFAFPGADVKRMLTYHIGNPV